MGKSKGKTILSIVGFALGAAAPQIFGLKSGAWLAGGIYGASLGGTLWSVTHKPKNTNASRFDQYMNNVSSESMIPIVYGHRKVGGYQTYHQVYSDGKKLRKDVLLSEGTITEMYGVSANNLFITKNSDNGLVFRIYNTLYPDATVAVRLFSGGKTLVLSANGETISIELKKTSDIYASGSNDYQCLISKLIQYLTEYGYTNGLKSKGWHVDYPVHIEGGPNYLTSFSEVNCYNNPIEIKRIGIEDCTFTFYDGSQATPPDNYLKVGSYKNMAYLRATLTLGDVLTGGNPTITAIIKGIKIWVYRNNEWHYEYSNCPSWIIYDYLTNKRYGLGRWFDASMLDLDAFIEAADYCDQLVDFKDTDGVIRQEKRYELDIILSDKKNAIEHLQDMLANFNGFLVFTNDKISLRLEKPTDVSFSFTDDTIVRDSVAFTQTPLEDTPNKYNVKYVDPYNNWTAVPVVIEDYVDQDERGTVIPKDIELGGTIRQTQAKRVGNINKNLNKLCSLVITFSTGTFAAHLEPGDVVNVTYRNYFSEKPFRILEIQEQNGVYTIKAREYNESVYDDNYLAEIEVKNYTSIPNAISDEIPDVENIELSQTYYKQKDGTIVSDIIGSCVIPDYPFFKKVNIQYSIDNGITWVNYGDTLGNSFIVHNANTLTNYLIKLAVENSVGRRSNGTVSDPIYITGKDSLPGVITGLTYSISSTDTTKVILQWNKAEDVDFNRYSLRYGSSWSTGNIVSDYITDNTYMFTMPSSGTYHFMVKAVDNSGNYSENPAELNVNQTIEPAQVAGFSIAIQETDRSKILLSWQPNSDTDLSYYEIRMGNNGWNLGSIIATQLKATSYLHTVTTEGNLNFMIKAVSIAGHYSSTETVRNTQVILRPDTPVNLSVIQQEKDRSILKVSWDAAPGKDIAGYQLKYGTNWDTGVDIDTTRETSYAWTIVANGAYNIMVRAKNVAGYYSNVANIAVSPMINPYDVTGFTAYQSVRDRSYITLAWDNPISKDVAYFEIRMGSNGWDTATVIASRATGTFHEIQVLDESEHTYFIKAVSVAGHYSQNPSSIDGVFNLNPSPVSNIQISQNINDKSQLIITWTGISESDLVFYELRVGYEWDTATKIAETKETRWLHSISDTGDTKVIIKARNAAGFYSDEVFEHYYATVEPGPVTGFTAIQNGEYVELFWDKHSESDVVSYEISEGASFDMGQLVVSGVTTTEYTVKVDTERNYYYHIKAINRALKYSTTAASTGLYVANLPPKNKIEEYDEIGLQTGAQTNVEFGASLINWSNLGGRSNDYPTTKFSDVGGQTVLKLAKNGASYYASGTYQAITKDMEQVITANITADFRSTVVLRGAGSAVLQICTSQDGTNWTAWQDFKPAQYTFRYLDARVMLATEDPTNTPEVNHLTIKIDVPDTDKAGANVDIPVGGQTVYYGHTYYEVPVLTPTAIGENRFPVILEKTKTSFTVKITDRTGVSTGGTLDWRAKGY